MNFTIKFDFPSVELDRLKSKELYTEKADSLELVSEISFGFLGDEFYLMNYDLVNICISFASRQSISIFTLFLQMFSVPSRTKIQLMD